MTALASAPHPDVPRRAGAASAVVVNPSKVAGDDSGVRILDLLQPEPAVQPAA